jgi:ribosome-associated heat shock protein Hsp15
MGDSVGSVRIDRWLWAARFYKTRSQAGLAVKAGKVDVQGTRAKPSQQVRCGHQIEVHKGLFRVVVRVTGLADRRGSAELARTLFEELAESVQARAEIRARLAAEGSATENRVGARPTKKDRRALIAFRQEIFFPEDLDDDWD